MSIYEEIISAADKMDEFALSIEIDNDPAIITNLKRERFHLMKIADDLKKLQIWTDTVQRRSAYLQRMLFYELLKQNDQQFVEKVKPVLGSQDFEWRVQHQMFTDSEISSAMAAVIEKEPLL